MDGKLLTVREAAKLIRHHPETVRRWARSGKVEAVYVGNKILIPLVSLLHIIKPMGLGDCMASRKSPNKDGGGIR